MPLTDTEVRNAKPGEKPSKLFDGKGLFLLVSPAGGKWWRFRYKFLAKEKLLSLGTYPDTTLREARDLRDRARKLLAQDIDPGEHRKVTKSARIERAGNTFEAVAREWFAKQKPNWVKAHGDRILRRFENDLFPCLGGRPIAEIRASELLDVVRKIEKRGAIETAHRALSSCGQVFRYAIASGLAERDISSDLRGALPPVKGTHFAAITDPTRVGQLLRALEGHQGSEVVRSALKLAPMVFVRPGELRTAAWEHIDLKQAEWRYFVSKTQSDHIVPLSTQAVGILEELKKLTGHGRYVFPGARSNGRPMSDNAILAAMRSLGIPADEMSGHGFRAMARTILDEVLNFRPDIIEHQLAHAVKDPNGRAYNRTAHLKERKVMMQSWSDYLGSLKSGAQIIELPDKAA